MFHPGDNDLVAGFKLVRQTARQLIGQRCHVGADQDLAGVIRTQKICHGLGGIGIQRINLNGCRIKDARIAVESVEEIDDSVDGLLGHLRACCIVKINATLTLIGRGERRKLGAHRVYRNCHIGIVTFFSWVIDPC